MTTTNRLEKAQWKRYFDQMSKSLEGKRVEIEVAALDIGIQYAAEWLPVFGMSYDEKDDLIAVMAEGLNHLIRRPRSVFVTTDGDQVQSVEVIDADSAARIVRFRNAEPVAPA